ncbi:MAG: ABC transporter ATP-binding protein [Bacteroidetes bacterium]|nr:ABC transporter ATP-binding protein [Bacteroidota bacterium]
MATLLELEHITAGYGEEIIFRDVSLVVEKGAFIGVIGPNGGGKTTLVKIILGLLKPIQGSIRSYLETEIGYLPQNNPIDRKFPITVREVVMSGLISKDKFFVRFDREHRKKAESIMERMGILHLRNKSVGMISGGQLQRALLGRAIISDPHLLVLDEPGTFVDNRFEKDLYELLVELNNTVTIMMVSHDVGTISAYVKSIVCINRNLHYHRSNIITPEQLAQYNCPIQLITHGDVPHTVLSSHKD